MFPATVLHLSERLLAEARAQRLTLATAESCTGGLIAAALTEIPGSSDVLERGFVSYANEAKQALLGVPGDLIATYGAVSEPVARAMALGVLAHSPCDLAIAVTGVAGPGGGTAQKPVGLVHIAAARRHGEVLHEERRFGPLSRHEIRMGSVEAALALALRLL